LALTAGLGVLGAWSAAPPASPQLEPKAAPGEHARRLLDEALLAAQDLERQGLGPSDELLGRFREAAAAAPGAVPPQFDLAVALERAGRTGDAASAYRAVAGAHGGPMELRLQAAERAEALSLERGDPAGARAAAALAAAVEPLRGLSLQAELELSLGDGQAAQALARSALMRASNDVRALCALARAQLMLGQAGTASILARRAARLYPRDARPQLALAEIARAASDGPAELAAARAAVAADPRSVPALALLGRLLLRRGDAAGAQAAFARATSLGGGAAAHLGLGAALAQQGRTAPATDELQLAAQLAPRAASPHLLLARLKLESEHDAAAALEEARLFVKLSGSALPAGHPIHALLKRCEQALAAKAPPAAAPGTAAGGAP
jgi:Flp pilus assembly protein TadD